MIIIVKNLPEDTYLKELTLFVGTALKRGLFFRSGSIYKAEILSFRNKMTDQHEFHGLVHAEPEEACRLAIQKLRSRRFKNKLLIVKEYFERDARNERRNNQILVPANIMEKRSGERRRGDQLEVVPEVVTMFRAVSPSRKLF